MKFHPCIEGPQYFKQHWRCRVRKSPYGSNEELFQESRWYPKALRGTWSQVTMNFLNLSLKRWDHSHTASVHSLSCQDLGYWWWRSPCRTPAQPPGSRHNFHPAPPKMPTSRIIQLLEKGSCKLWNGISDQYIPKLQLYFATIIIFATLHLWDTRYWTWSYPAELFKHQPNSITVNGIFATIHRGQHRD